MITDKKTLRLGERICEALGVDPYMVSSIRLEIGPRGTELTIGMNVEQVAAEAIVEEMNQRVWILKEECCCDG